jgi:hypothetical protein
MYISLKPFKGVSVHKKMQIKMKALSLPFTETRTPGVEGCMKLDQFHDARETG